MTREPSDPLDWDKVDDGRGVILWASIALGIASFLVICWLLYQVLKAEPWVIA